MIENPSHDTTHSAVPWSHIFWAIGLILILRSCYTRQSGESYTGADLLTYTDTLREKVWFTDGHKNVSDKYHIQLAYGKSEFVIAGNGCSIIKRNEDKKKLIFSLTPGDIVTVTYEWSDGDRIDNGRNELKIIGLRSDGKKILTPEEVLRVDKTDFRNYNIAAIALLAAGGISYYLRKNKNKQQAA